MAIVVLSSSRFMSEVFLFRPRSGGSGDTVVTQPFGSVATSSGAEAVVTPGGGAAVVAGGTGAVVTSSGGGSIVG